MLFKSKLSLNVLVSAVRASQTSWPPCRRSILSFSDVCDEVSRRLVALPQAEQQSIVEGNKIDLYTCLSVYKRVAQYSPLLSELHPETPRENCILVVL